MIRAVCGLWRRRWGLLRLSIAVFLLWSLTADTGARLARLSLAALPGYDYLGEATRLREAGRYGDALIIADAGLADPECPTHQQLVTERAQTVREQSSWIRRVEDVGLGAISGQGQSLERLIGAVGADFFIVGDVRDLVLQGTKQLVDGQSDELILLLSGVGLATTLLPEIDWAPSLLKIARKMGALPRRMGEALTEMLRTGKRAEAAKVCEDVAVVAKKASPAGAIRVLRLAETPEELGKLARFVEREDRAAFALGVLGRDAGELAIKAGADADKTILKAAAKGERGGAWLRAGGYRALMKPHALVGLLKGLRKGTLADLVARTIEALDGKAWWVVPLLAAWVFVELGLLLPRRGRPSHVLTGQLQPG